jgi:hypothetical protein
MNQLLDTEEMLSAARQGPELCIEFFGLPGSGKSTIARNVHAALSRIHPEIVFAPDLLADEARGPVRVATKLRLILSEIVRNGAILDLARKTLATRQPRLRDRLRAVFTVATVASLYSSLRRRHMGAVLDQGMLQAIWSIQLRLPITPNSGLVRDMIKNAAYARHIYVSVEVPAEVCAERLEARVSKHSRMQTTGGGRDLHAWEKAELLRRTILSDFLAACRKQGIPQRVIVVDGSADPVVTAGQIVAAYQQIRTAQVSPSDVHGHEMTG